MIWLNICQFIGSVHKDPETRYTGDGAGVTRLLLAVSEEWKDKAGQKQGRTTWVPVVCFGKLSEFVAEKVKKGARVYVQGRFSVRQYEKNGEKRWATEIIGDKVLGLDERAEEPEKKAESSVGTPGDRFSSMEDDIPF